LPQEVVRSSLRGIRAQRILAEAIARDLGPKGVHVAYLVIDAVIVLAWTRQQFSDKPGDFFIRPDAIAEEVWHLIHQPRCAWSFNAELRPFRKPDVEPYLKMLAAT
jgi:hypothetical protein